MNLGVGLGLPGIKPGIENKALVANALINRSPFLHSGSNHSAIALQLLTSSHLRDNILTEQQMMEDKIKATDWEATNEAIEEQVGSSFDSWHQN